MTFRQFAYRNVVRNRRIYAAFFMASVFSVMVFFLYSMLLFHPSIEDRFIQEIAFVGMAAAEIILYIFTLFFLFYSMRAFLHARSKEFGILLHLGMEKRQLYKLIFIETMLLGVASIAVGTFLGFAFSKFFFMGVREIVLLPALPLYLSWEPFALTIGAFLSLFMIISFVAPIFIRSGETAHLIRGETQEKDGHEYSKVRGYLGLVCLGVAYGMAASTSNDIVISLLFLLPPLATIGTFYFFTDSLPLLLHMVKKRKRVYWQHFRLLSISEGIVRLRENARMFFIVTIVSTIAFMSVGTLASLTSFASQYREMNPLGLVYISEVENELEKEHIAQLEKELQAHEINYVMEKIPILYQTSTYTGKMVAILSVSDMNKVSSLYNHLAIQLKEGEALFLPPSASSFKSLNERIVPTMLEESKVQIEVFGAYPYQLFPANSINANAIVLNDIDFNKIAVIGMHGKFKPTMYYAFDVPEWQRTKEIGLSIDDTITE